MNRHVIQFILLSLVGLSLQGCGTRVQTVEVERLKVEYRDRMRLERDSVYLHDSIYVERQGDTVYRDRWRTSYREVVRLDTAYAERRDSISYPVVVEVERPRSWLSRLEVNAYRLVILLLAIYALWHTLRTLLWRRRQ